MRKTITLLSCALMIACGSAGASDSAQQAEVETETIVTAVMTKPKVYPA